MKKFGWILAAALILAAGLQAQTQKAKTVDCILVQVNDDIITHSDLERELVQLREELRERFSGTQLEQELERRREPLLEELIRRKLMLQKANELGMGSGMDLQVSAHIENLSKQFNIPDMEQFERALEKQGMTLAGFREETKKAMIIQDLRGYFVDSRIMLLDEELERYYREHAKDFSSPEEVTLSEIVVSAGGADGQAEALIQEYRKRAMQGESFASLASQYSKGPTAAKGGGIGSYQVAKLAPDIARALASVKTGEVTDVIKVKEGYAILRVDERKPSVARPYEEVKNEIKQILYVQKSQPEFERFIAQLKEDAYIQRFVEVGSGK